MQCLRQSLVLAAFACLPLASLAQGAWPPATEAPHDARTWLQRSQDAASKRNYLGTLVVTANGVTSTSRLAHFNEGGVQGERVDWLDGERRTMIRLNESVQTFWPRSRLAVVEPVDARASFPGLFAQSGKGLLDNYEWRRLGRDRVAGLDADVVMLKARDALRYSQRLWSESASGLLLRAEVLAAGGQVLESVGFTEVNLGVKSQLDGLQAALRQTDGYRVARPTATKASLEAEGWQLAALPAGFREIQCARRVLGPANDPRSPVVLQAIFGDGLTHVSAFIEPFDPERHQVRSAPPMGATNTLGFRRESHWITVVGDVPAETLQRFADALTRRH